MYRGGRPRGVLTARDRLRPPATVEMIFVHVASTKALTLGTPLVGWTPAPPAPGEGHPYVPATPHT